MHNVAWRSQAFCIAAPYHKHSSKYTDAPLNPKPKSYPNTLPAMQVAGFLPRDPEYSTLLQTVKCTVPALFVVGESDELIPPDRSAALMATWHAPAAELLKHGGAHMVPTCSGPVKQQIVSFLDRYRADEGSVHSTTVSKQECASASAT
jgi:pimeloyl-ACP methyl ester carboxylesterase